MFDNCLDRCKAGTAGNQQHRFSGVLAHEETAVWSAQAQQVSFLHGSEDVSGELAAWHLPNMELKEVVCMWCVGQRERAAPAFLEQNGAGLP